MEFAVTAQRIAQSAFRFRERRWIENDQVVLRFCFFGAAKECKNVLLDPADFQSVPLRVAFSGGYVFRIFFNNRNVAGAAARARERARAFVRKKIENGG